MRATRARILLVSALPQGWVSICQKGNHQVQIIIRTIIDGCRDWLDSTLKWACVGQRSVNDIWSSKEGNRKVIWELSSITNVFSDFIGKTASDTVTAPSWKWASTEGLWFLALHLGLSECWFEVVIHIRCIGGLFRHNNAWYLCYPIIKMIFNWESTIFSILSQVITKWSGSV